MRGIWAKHFDEAVALVRRELVAIPGMIQSQEDILSRGRISGIGPKVMKEAGQKQPSPESKSRWPRSHEAVGGIRKRHGEAGEARTRRTMCRNAACSQRRALFTKITGEIKVLEVHIRTHLVERCFQVLPMRF
jgi:hypothetical protein